MYHVKEIVKVNIVRIWQINIVLSKNWIAQSHFVLQVSQVMDDNRKRGKI